MAKAKTKTTVKAKSASPTSKRLTISELKKKVTDPKNKKSLIIAVVIILVIVGLYLSKSLFIAATVNGQPIPRLAVVSELEKQSGQVVLDNLITRLLVKQEAEKNDVNISEEDINKEIEKIGNQFKEQGQDLNALLEAQGLSEKKFREEIEIQLIVTKLLGDDAKVTDEEFDKFMTDNPDLIAEDENAEESRAALRTQLEQQKIAQKYQEWMMKVKSEASINTLVNY